MGQNEGDIATVGITDFAQSELGDIVYVEVETLDETLDAEEVFGTVGCENSFRFILPLSGEIIAFNEELRSTRIVNSDPYNDGWMIQINAMICLK